MTSYNIESEEDSISLIIEPLEKSIIFFTTDKTFPIVDFFNGNNVNNLQTFAAYKPKIST